MLLQAKRLLESDNTLPALPATVTQQQIELRKRQFEIAKQIDAEAAIAQEAGVASLNRVWAARRTRIDSEILLVQAIVQERLQDTPGQ